MKQGRELWEWARQQVLEAPGADTAALTDLVMRVYLRGGIEALADEIARIKVEQRAGAVGQADGSPV